MVRPAILVQSMARLRRQGARVIRFWSGGLTRKINPFRGEGPLVRKKKKKQKKKEKKKKKKKKKN